ncbi:hypothetical protein, partial [Pseudomonas sp. Kh13]|uniref:hypothetical protein n=1 Tax=Pseudomonas sp. Kh13 TaxID=2093744 RepID=UPI0015B48CC8
DMSPRNLEKVLYFAAYIVIDPGSTDLKKYDIINEREYRDYINQYGRHDFVAKMGTEAIKDLLNQIDIDAVAEELREQLHLAKGQKKSRLIK